jgi:hypothetical protein
MYILHYTQIPLVSVEYRNVPVQQRTQSNSSGTNLVKMAVNLSRDTWWRKERRALNAGLSKYQAASSVYYYMISNHHNVEKTFLITFLITFCIPRMPQDLLFFIWVKS